MLTATTPAGGTAILHISVDLLFAFRIEECEIDTLVDDQMTEAQKLSWAAYVAEATAVEGFVQNTLYWSGVILPGSLGVVDAYITMSVEPATKLAIMVGYLALSSHWLMALLMAYEAGTVTASFVVGLLGMWLSLALSSSIVLGLFALITPILWHVSNLFDAFRENYRSRLLWGIVSVAFNFFVAVSMWLVWIHYLEVSITEYMEAQQ